MIKFCKPIIYLTLIIVTSFSATAQSDDFSTIMDRIRNSFLAGSTTTLDNSVTSYLTNLNANGSWSDINYADKSATIWQPSNHWVRLSAFCRAYSKSGSTYYGSPALRESINNAINYWFSISPEPSSTNWYFGTISNPKEMGTVIIAMRYVAVPLDATIENAIVTSMAKGIPITQSPSKDGSNLTDVAQNYIMRACITKDQALLNQAITAVSNSIVIDNSTGGTIGEGIQVDNSYTSHGPQLYLYGYGDIMMSGINNIAAYVKGTSYEIAANKIAIYSNFARKGMLKSLRANYNDFNAFNRQISRPNAGKIGATMFTNAKNIDLPENAAEYDAAISRINGIQPPSYKITPEHIHFWRSDYTVHHRPKYMFGLRSVSSRTVKAENGNNENLKGYYSTEGANYIAIKGDEYFNIYPVWEWNKIPGTTVPEITTYPLRTQWGVNYGKVAFVGGVSDGVFGVSTYAMNDYNTQAKKSWFFFDDEVVCLGAGINSGATQPINTSVNQCLLNGAVNVKTNATIQTLSNGSQLYAGNLQWAHHNNVGYIFPQGGTISLSNQAQSGTQNSLNTAYSTTLITKDVFKLWFQHGINPSNASYAYIVTPGISLEEMDSYNASKIQIWSNTSTSQAVYHSGLDILQLVFYQAGNLTYNGYTITSDNACTFMIKNFTKTNKEVFVADPSQTLSGINLSLQNINSGAKNTYKANLPTGIMAGSSVMAEIVPSAPVAFIANYDAFVRDGSFANSNFPTGNLIVKKDDVGYTRSAYLQFDLTSYTEKLESVYLQLYVSYSNTNTTDTNWEFYEETDNNWTETGITWNNKPVSTDKLIATLPGKNAGNYIKIPITETVLNRLSLDKKLTIRISSTVTGANTDSGFESRESPTVAYRPTLMIQSTEEVTPSICMLRPIF